MKLLGFEKERTDDDWRWIISLRRADLSGSTERLVEVLRSESELTQERRALLADLLERKQLKNKKRGPSITLFPLISGPKMKAKKKARLENAASKVRQMQRGELVAFKDLYCLLPEEMRLRWDDGEEITAEELIKAATPRLGELPKRMKRVEAIAKYTSEMRDFDAETLTRFMDGKGFGSRKRKQASSK